MEMDDTPLKDLRRRGSTKGYDSPDPKRLTEDVNQRTCDAQKKTETLIDAQSERLKQSEGFRHFDNTIKKLKALDFRHFLERHKIQEKYRAKMIDWMVEVLNTFKQKESTLYRAVFLMDYYYSESTRDEKLDDLHITGIACMMIASKSEEVDFIRVDTFINLIGKNKFTRSDLLKRELEILTAIKFRTCGPTLYELLKCALVLVDIEDCELKAFIEKSSLMLTKMCLFSYQMLNSLSLTELTLYCLIISLKVAEKLKKFDSRPSVI